MVKLLFIKCDISKLVASKHDELLINSISLFLKFMNKLTHKSYMVGLYFQLIDGCILT